MLKLSYACFDTVVTVSESQLRWLHARRLKSVQSSQALLHCTDLEPFLELETPVLSQPLVFGAIGRFCYQKGFDDLLSAWKRLSPKNAILLIAGYGDGEEQLKALAESCPSIQILSPQRAVGFFSRCHWTIIPSRYEPFGQVCLESKAAGRPVIVSNVDGLPEQVLTSRSGLVCPSPSLESCIERAIELCNHSPELYEEFSFEARQSAQKCFDGYPKRILSILSDSDTS